VVTKPTCHAFFSGDSSFCQILYDHTALPPAPPSSPGPWSPEAAPAFPSLGVEVVPAQPSGAPEPSPAIAKAKEFVADIFRRAKEAKGSPLEETRLPSSLGPSSSRCRPSLEPQAPSGEVVPRDSPPAAETTAPEPGYINYTKLHYVLQSGEGTEPEDGELPSWDRIWDGAVPRGLLACSYLLPASPEFEDDKISLPFVVTDLRGRNLRPMRERTDMQVGSHDASHGW
jgi:DDB1- and CUL4-associated factor 15